MRLARRHRHPSSARPALAYPGTNGTRIHQRLTTRTSRVNVTIVAELATELTKTGPISKANREANCPAFTATCNKCSLTGHFSAVCRKRVPQKWGKADNLGSTPNSGYSEKMTPKSENSASATDRSMHSVYEEMCGASVSQHCGISAGGAHVCGGDTNVKTMAVEYMAHITSIGSRGRNTRYKEFVIESQQFNTLRGGIEGPVQGQPTITLQARVVPSDYAHFGYRFTKPARTCQLRAITDTCCQSTIMNLEQVHKIGYTKTDLIPTELRMQAIHQPHRNHRGYHHPLVRVGHTRKLGRDNSDLL